MNRTLIAVLALSVGLAGCTEPGPIAVPDGVIQGVVLAPGIVPIDGATVRLGNTTQTTGPDGLYRFSVPPGEDLLLSVDAPQFFNASLTVARPPPGTSQWVNLTLQPVPVEEPFVVVESFDGFLACSAFVVVGHDHGTDPDGDDVVQCGTGTDTATWDLPIPTDLEGLIVETTWDAQTPGAENLFVYAQAMTADGPGDVIAFKEGPDVLRLQFARLSLQDHFPDGGTMRIQYQVGAGPDNEDVAAGVAYEQEFQSFASLFFVEGPETGYAFVS